MRLTALCMLLLLASCNNADTATTDQSADNGNDPTTNGNNPAAMQWDSSNWNQADWQ